MNVNGTAIKRPLRWMALAALAGVITLSGSLRAETVLRVVPHADLKNIDPIWTTAYISRNHGYMVWDTLFAVDSKLEPQPQMVDTWKVSPDGLTYTFTLRSGLLWHDGKPVTSADCVASIKRWGKRDGMGQKLMAVTKDLEVVNDRTFRLVLKEPYGLVLDSLGKISSNVPFMMPERLANTDPFKQVPESIGSGPFIFMKDEWVPGNKVVYVKNPHYKPRPEAPDFAAGGKVVKVDRVEWIYIPDNATAQAALTTGEVDYWELPPVDLLPTMEKNPDIVVFNADPLGYQGWLRPNSLLPPFNNPKARLALLWMVDQEIYLRAVIGNPKYFKVCPAFFVCGGPYETDAGSGPLMRQDFGKARQLLKEAGYKGEKVVLMHPTDIAPLSAATLVTAQLLRKIGVNVDLQAMDWSTLTSRRAEKKPVAEGGWNLFHTQWVAPDVITPVNNIGVSGGCTEKAWFGWPCDEKIENLREAWARTTDPAKRKELAVEIQKRAYEIVPYVPIGQYFQPIAYRRNLHGIIPSPVPFFWNISKD